MTNANVPNANMTNAPSAYAPVRHNIRSKITLWAPWTMLLVFSIAGCGPSGPEVAKVSGTVTLDGKPLPEAFVYFRHADGGRISEAFTDEAGQYKLNYSSEESGAMVGSNTVRISTFIEAVREDSGAIVKGTNKKELVPAKYNKQTELTVEVKSGNNTLNFDLKSK